MEIREILTDKKKYLPLLLLADEQEDMIDRYLERGTMYVLEEGGVKAECVVTDEGDGILEIKSLAVEPDFQGQGYGKALIRFLAEKYRLRYSILQAGTGDSPLTVPFYEACGFRRSHRIPDFFTEHYDHPIFEGGVQLKDMVYLRKELCPMKSDLSTLKSAPARPARGTAADVQAVVTSFNQGSMILEAVQSLCAQTTPPAKIILVDDGSTDAASLAVLDRLETDPSLPVPVRVLRQPNGGVSSARNTGIRNARTPFVLVLDGDDRLEPAFLEKVSALLRSDPSLAAASSWMQTFGVLEAQIRPAGGTIVPFLSRNCCPATHILRRSCWEACGGYDEAMRSGFEDWDFFLSMLETAPDAHIGIVPEPLIAYRTAPASSNVRSMEKRLELMRHIISRHPDAYREHLTDALLGLEAVSMSRLFGWENEMLHALQEDRPLSAVSEDFLRSPSYGDGGMAAAVRIATALPSLFQKP